MSEIAVPFWWKNRPILCAKCQNEIILSEENVHLDPNRNPNDPISLRCNHCRVLLQISLKEKEDPQGQPVLPNPTIHESKKRGRIFNFLSWIFRSKKSRI